MLYCNSNFNGDRLDFIKSAVALANRVSKPIWAQWNQRWFVIDPGTTLEQAIAEYQNPAYLEDAANGIVSFVVDEESEELNPSKRRVAAAFATIDRAKAAADLHRVAAEVVGAEGKVMVYPELPVEASRKDWLKLIAASE